MSVAQTSIDAHTDLHRSRKVLTLDESVFNALNVVREGLLHFTGRKPRTRREVAYVLNEEASTVSGAINRLIAKKQVVVIGKLKCAITGKTVEEIKAVA